MTIYPVYDYCLRFLDSLRHILAFELKKPTLVLVFGKELFTHHKWMWIRPTNKNCLSCHTRMVGQIDMVGVGNDQIMVTPSIYNHLKTKQ